MTDEKAKRLLAAMASLSEGVCFVDDGDFVGFEARYASGKVQEMGRFPPCRRALREGSCDGHGQ